MRILYVSIAYPLPANNGSKMRLWAVLRAMASVGHQVTLAAFAEPEEVDGTEQELQMVCKDSDIVPLHYARLSGGGSYLSRLRAIFSSLPFTIDRFRSDDMRLRLERRVRDRSFDVVICDNAYSAINLPASASPIVMNSQNVEYLILQRYAEQEKNPLKALYARLEATKLRRFEAVMYRRAACGMACSTVDAALVRQLCPGLKVFVAPMWWTCVSTRLRLKKTRWPSSTRAAWTGSPTAMHWSTLFGKFFRWCRRKFPACG